ncbi:MAG: MarR family winged helix-turn-helix transcriptional regulator [Sphingomonas sp.]
MEDNSIIGANSVVGEWEGLFRSPSGAPRVTVAKVPSSPTPGEKAAAVYHARRVRDGVFGDSAHLFTDPAWDMMLNLFISQEESRQVSVNHARAASGVPPTTALRWIGILTASGMIVRRADPTDRRRCYLELSARGDAMMREWLALLP